MQKINTYIFCTDVIEHSFAHTEIQQIATNYKSVIIYCKNKSKYPLPSNVHEKCISFTEYDSKKTFLNNLKTIGIVLAGDILFRSFNWSYYKTIKSNLSYLTESVYISEEISADLKEKKINTENTLFVSFWFNTWATALSILKSKKIIPSFFSRAHGTDLFEYRVRNTQRIPFRLFQLKHVKKLFSVSQNGADYLKQKYPKYAHKVYKSYLGTEDKGLNLLTEDPIFTIVSCAKVRNIKRIFLIPEILKKLDFPVKWIHLGDENLSANDPTKSTYIANKKSLENFNNIEVIIKGNLSNEAIFDFYQKVPVHLFLSVSETEGLPVSIMEAISFGIPVMATDVGGCKEIVNETTGILIPKDFSNDSAAELIKNFKNSNKNSMENRNKIRIFWQNNFEVKKNYQQFFNQLEEK